MGLDHDEEGRPIKKVVHEGKELVEPVDIEAT